MHLTVVQVDTFSNLLHVLSSHGLVEEHVIDLLLEELRVCELRGEVAVVGEQQHARGVTVEASYGIDALGTDVLHEVHHRLALLWVIAGGHVVLRLVQQHVDLLLQRHGSVVEHNLVGAQHLCSKLGHHLTVHLHRSGLYELVGLATAADACIGQELIQADGLVRINVDLLIFDAFLQAVLGIGIQAALALVAIGRTLLAVALLTSLIAATLLTVALLTSLIAATLLAIALLTRLVATALLTVALLTGLVALLIALAIVARTIALLRTLAIALLRMLIATLCIGIVVSGAIALLARLSIALLARLIALLTIVVARTIRALCLIALLQRGSEAFRTEASFVIGIACSGCVGTGRLMNAGTRTAARLTIALIVG